MFVEEEDPVPQQQSGNVERQQDDNSGGQQDPTVLQTDPPLSNQVVPQSDARPIEIAEEEEPEDLQIAVESISQGQAQGQGGQEDLPKTGDKGDGNKWTQLGGYVLISGAIVGVARILIIKKKHQSGV